MKKKDLHSYLRAAAERWIEGVRLQAQRCAGAREGDLFFDSNFLVVSVKRLCEVARMARDRLGESRLREPLERFDAAHPEFGDVRDYQEHILDPELIGSAVYVAGGALFRLCPDGRAVTIVDPEAL